MRIFFGIAPALMVVALVGCSGSDGSNGAPGATGPAGTKGATGPVGSVGPTGASGATGTAGPFGASGPAGADGANGTPGLQGNVGPTGATGVTGASGESGSQILFGNGAPASTYGINGDTYIDIDTHDLYRKSVGTWSLVVNINGLMGPTGPNGLPGSTGPTGPTGSSGPAGADGATGPTGATGTAATAWLTGAGLPSADLGSTNDIYLDLDTNYLYRKLADDWRLLGSLAAPSATMNGWNWNAYVYPTGGMNAVEDAVSAPDYYRATLTVIGNATNPAGGGIGWTFSSPATLVSLTAYKSIKFRLELAVASGTVSELDLVVGQGSGAWSCDYRFDASSGSHNYDVDISATPTICHGTMARGEDAFKPVGVDSVSIALPGSAELRTVTMTLSNVQLVLK